MIRPAAALLLFFGSALAAHAQSLPGNPVADAARAIGRGGLQDGAAPATSPTGFKSDGTRRVVAACAKQLGEDDAQRKAYEEIFLKLLESYEKQIVQAGNANDAAGALAFSVAVVYAAAKETELDDQAFLALIPRLQATLDLPAVRNATDAQKQECYEWALCASGTVLAVAQLAETAEAKAGLKKLARAQLENLIGTDADRLTLKGKEIVLKAAGGGVAPGFAFTLPEGWSQESPWYLKRKVDHGTITSAMVRFPPSIEARGEIGATLRELWKSTVPAELAGRHSSMVYRRYLGDGLVAHFVYGVGLEKGRVADSVFSLYLIDLGDRWQPMVVAQTYEDPTFNVVSAVRMMGSTSVSVSAAIAEEFLATLRCPAAKGRALVSKEALVGDYGYGSASSLQWENIYTGATSMTVVSYGGTLNLQADGTFTSSFQSASGQVGAMQFGSEKDKGTWEIQGDLLLLHGARERKYRVAGVTQFDDGVKVAVLFLRMDLVVNAATGGDRSDWFSTKKK